MIFASQLLIIASLRAKIHILLTASLLQLLFYRLTRFAIQGRRPDSQNTVLPTQKYRIHLIPFMHNLDRLRMVPEPQPKRAVLGAGPERRRRFRQERKEMKKMNTFLGGNVVRRPLLKTSVVLTAVLICVSSWSFAWEYPVIKGYGPADPLPSAAFQPDKSIKYRVLFDITKAAETVDKVNPGLDRVARFLNVMAASNIMPRDMELAAVIHGPAAPSVLKSEIFRNRFKKDNPNEKLIMALREAGVKLFVCGQTLADDGFKDKWVNEGIAIAVSALVVVPTYQLKGYAYLPLF